MFQQGKAGELEVGEGARLDIGKDRLWNRQGGHPGHHGQQVSLAAGRFAPTGVVSLLACANYDLAVNVVGDVV
jgi:hypothetical protein